MVLRHFIVLFYLLSYANKYTSSSRLRYSATELCKICFTNSVIEFSLLVENETYMYCGLCVESGIAEC